MVPTGLTHGCGDLSTNKTFFDSDKWRVRLSLEPV